MAAGDLDRAGGQHARARGGHLQHLLEAEQVELARGRNEPGIRRVDAVDVGVDLADVSVERGRERHCGRVGAAPPECRHVQRVR